MPDQETRFAVLMALGQQGDASAYRELLVALQGRLSAYFSRRLAADAASVDDLVQETLMAVHVKRATYDPGLAFSGWLYGIARYKLIDHYRRLKVRRTEPLDEARFAADLADDAEAAGARMDLEELLGRLPEKQARAIRLTRIDGLSTREAAAALGTSESSIKVSVHRGLKTASASLDDSGKTDP
ncbi:sigma-70 family RNA polymerase sigma factor [Hyphobacterium marinum]|uniref:Sigma-70 family RNA polymerase sigma factor n=1 Tax=Hyphobacterium marinum TaxID=3116574 RepID=A0ABU7LVC4_9PROT|nr:sigma-70 family RNA polymerase sigma factor [Hyphobacterium sp. Y6023]MEE2565519.1 sigma-70 family RNA polymerase sigma factor [Hyphobacterium sp. Y6023]